MRRYSRDGVAAVVDHTLLKPEATEADVVALLAEAEELDVCAVCVSPTMVATAKGFRTGEYDIASVVGDIVNHPDPIAQAKAWIAATRRKS